MANGRFLSKTISTSAQLAGVSDAAEVLFYRMIPHLDVSGRLEGDPRLVKAAACPLKESFTVERISELLYELAETKDADGEGLIVWYQARGKMVVQFPGFDRHQHLRKDREGATRLPAITDGGATLVARRQTPRSGPNGTPGVSRELAGRTPAEVKVSEVQVEVQDQVKLVGPSARIPVTWVDEFVALYKPVGLIPHGRLGKALKPVIEEYGIDTSRQMWEYYIRHAPHLRFGKLDPANRDTSRMSPEDFVRNAGTWYDKTQPIGGHSAATAS